MSDFQDKYTRNRNTLDLEMHAVAEIQLIKK